MLLFFYKIPVRIRSESEWFPLPLSPPPTDVIAARRRVGVLVLVDGHVAELLHVVVIVVVAVVIVVALVLVRRVGNLDHWKNGIKLLRDWLAHCVLRRSISLMVWATMHISRFLYSCTSYLLCYRLSLGFHTAVLVDQQCFDAPSKDYRPISG